MGTSHHEPMLRAQQEWKRHGVGPWDYATNAKNLDAFWEKGIERNENYESIITLGMRGDGDKPMAEKDDIALLEKIVADQRADHRAPSDSHLSLPIPRFGHSTRRCRATTRKACAFRMT